MCRGQFDGHKVEQSGDAEGGLEVGDGDERVGRDADVAR